MKLEDLWVSLCPIERFDLHVTHACFVLAPLLMQTPRTFKPLFPRRVQLLVETNEILRFYSHEIKISCQAFSSKEIHKLFVMLKHCSQGERSRFIGVIVSVTYLMRSFGDENNHDCIV